MGHGVGTGVVSGQTGVTGQGAVESGVGVVGLSLSLGFGESRAGQQSKNNEELHGDF